MFAQIHLIVTFMCALLVLMLINLLVNKVSTWPCEISYYYSHGVCGSVTYLIMSYCWSVLLHVLKCAFHLRGLI